MAIDEIFTLLESLQRTGRVPSPKVLSEAPGNPAIGALKTIGSGLTLAPLVKGLLRLFGNRGAKREVPALEKFELPAPIRTEIGLSKNGESYVVDRGAGDRVRRVEDSVPAPLMRPAATASPAATAITVNVQAMDSQSFMDRRDDIASAVREAMLHSHNVSDVVSEI
jgi:hypothetical protein